MCGRRRVAGRRGRRERRHVPRAPRRSRHRHQCRARPPRPLRRLRRAACRVRAVRRRDAGAVCRVRRRPVVAAARGDSPGRRHHLRVRRRRRLPASATTRAAATARGSRCVRGGTELGASTLPVPGATTRRTRPAAAAWPLELGVPFAAVARGARRRSAGVARRFQFRGERDGVTFVDDYAHLPSEVHSDDRRGTRGRLGARGRRVPAAPLHPHALRCGSDFADAFAGADTVVLTDIYPAGETPQPGVSGRLRRCTRCSTRHPEHARRLPPAARRPARHVPRLARRGRRRAHARRRRPHQPCPTSGWRARDRKRPVVARRRRSPRSPTTSSARLGARATVERDVPSPRFTTYRFGGPVAVPVRVASLGALTVVVEAVADHDVPVLVIGKGSNLARRRSRVSPASRSCSAGELAEVDSSTSPVDGCGRRRRLPSRGSRGRRPRPGSPAWSSSSASPAASVARCG